MTQYQLMPTLSPDEYDTLRGDIAERGVQVPVEYDDAGNILDGHHRIMACQELGIKDWPRIVRIGMNEEDKIAHVLALNLARRHLSKEQRKELVVTLRGKGWSLRRIAELLGIGRMTATRDISTVPFGTVECSDCHCDDPSWEPADEPPDNEYEYIQCQCCGYVRRGNLLKITGLDGKRRDAHKPSAVVKNKTEHKRMQKALDDMDTDALPSKMFDSKRIERLAREQASERRAEDVTGDTTAGDIQLWLGDFRERGQEIADSSVDLIFTDPPYPQDTLPLWSDLSAFAARVLKPDGLLIAYTGAMYLPEVISRLGEHMRFWWSGTIVLGGAHSRVYNRNVSQGSKPLLFYVRDGFASDTWFEDTISSEGEQKEAHDWQQSIGAARYYIAKLCPPGGLVVDPFLGGGTTALAAKQASVNFIGIEIDKIALGSAEDRLHG